MGDRDTNQKDKGIPLSGSGTHRGVIASSFAEPTTSACDPTSGGGSDKGTPEIVTKVKSVTMALVRGARLDGDENDDVVGDDDDKHFNLFLQGRFLGIGRI